MILALQLFAAEAMAGAATPTSITLVGGTATYTGAVLTYDDFDAAAFDQNLWQVPNTGAQVASGQAILSVSALARETENRLVLKNAIGATYVEADISLSQQSSIAEADGSGEVYLATRNADSKTSDQADHIIAYVSLVMQDSQLSARFTVEKEDGTILHSATFATPVQYDLAYKASLYLLAEGIVAKLGDETKAYLFSGGSPPTLYQYGKERYVGCRLRGTQTGRVQGAVDAVTIDDKGFSISGELLKWHTGVSQSHSDITPYYNVLVEIADATGSIASYTSTTTGYFEFTGLEKDKTYDLTLTTQDDTDVNYKSTITGVSPGYYNYILQKDIASDKYIFVPVVIGKISGSVTFSGESMGFFPVTITVFEKINGVSTEISNYFLHQNDNGQYSIIVSFDGIQAEQREFTVSMSYKLNVADKDQDIVIYYNNTLSLLQATPVVVKKNATTSSIDFVVKEDTDADGLPDTYEILIGSNPLVADASSDQDHDGKSNLAEFLSDSDNDGIPNTSDEDDDGDGMPDAWERKYGSNPFVFDALWDKDRNGTTNYDEYIRDADLDGIPFGLDPDDDNDGMPDIFEVQYGLQPMVPDGDKDLDGDGISNLDEYLAHTNPAVENPRLQGRVTNTDGTGVSDFPVEAFSTTSTDVTFSATTDQDGFYAISVAPATAYRVMAGPSGTYQSSYFDNAATWREATVIEVKDAAIGNIDFVLTMGASIHGTVTGLTAGTRAVIEAWSPSTLGWNSITLTGTGQVLDYTITGLPEARDYELAVSASGFVNGFVKNDGSMGSWENRELFQTGTNTANIVLTPGQAISGTITGLTQGEKVMVTVYSASTSLGEAIVLTSTGTGDSYSISGLSPAQSDYRVGFWPDSHGGGYYSTSSLSPVPFELASAITTGTTNVNIMVAPGHIITGKVTGLSLGQSANIDAISESTWSMGQTVVSASGSGSDPYTLSSLAAAADYRVRIFSPEFQGGYYSTHGIVTAEEDATKVDTAAGGGIDFTLTSGRSISGLITGLAPGIVADLDAWSDAAWSWGGTTVYGTGGEAVAYTITGLAPATDYVVHFRPQGQGEQTRNDIDNSYNPTNIHFTVAQGRTLAGTVSGGKAYDVVRLRAQSETAETIAWTTIVLGSGGSGTAYTFTGLPPADDYEVWAYSSFNTAKKTGIALGAADFLSAVLDLTATYAVAGEIAGITANTFVTIQAWDADSAANVTRLGNGNFHFELPAGSYQVGVFALGYQPGYFRVKDGSLLTAPPALAPFQPQIDPDLSTLDLNSFRGYKIYGDVFFDNNGNSQLDAGEERDNVFIEAVAKTGGMARGAFSNHQGYFEIDGLAGGITYVVRSWSVAAGASPSIETVIDNADKQQLVILMPASSQAITGTVTKNSAAVNQAMVLLYDAAGTLFLNAAMTDDHGSFSFPGLEAKEYILKIDQNGDGTMEPLQGGVFSLKTTAGGASVAIVLE